MEAKFQFINIFNFSIGIAEIDRRTENTTPRNHIHIKIHFVIS